VKPPTSSSPIATMLDAGMQATYNLELVERLHGVVHGDVQGVGFRYFLLREARRLGLQGWVRNHDDGTVEFVAEGRRPDLERLKQAAEQGPRMARVKRVDEQWSAAAGGLGAFDLTG
jgi:acylphosphatase